MFLRVNGVVTLTKDVELSSSGNKNKLHISAAADGKLKKDGTRDVSFYDINLWVLDEKQYLFFKEHLKKGVRIHLVNALLKQSRWVDEQTQTKKSRLEIDANEIEILFERRLESSDAGQKIQPADKETKQNPKKDIKKSTDYPELSNDTFTDQPF